MTILTTSKTLSICAEEEDILANRKHFTILYFGVMYDPEKDFTGFQDNGRKATLHKDRIKEYMQMLPEAERVWENKRMQAVATNNKDTLSENLNTLLVNVLAQQSADAIFEATMPKVREKII